MAKDLSNCKAVVVDVSAPQCILEAFVEQYNSISLDIPYVLVASNCGANDRKKELMLSILEDTAPTVITGRLGDIVAVAQSVIEKSECTCIFMHVTCVNICIYMHVMCVYMQFWEFPLLAVLVYVTLVEGKCQPQD